MTTSDSIELRHQVDRTDTRHLSARMHKGGLRIEGQDLGDGVEAVFGKGLWEYEWVVDVAAADVTRVVEALGGRPGEHVIDVIRRTCADDPDLLEQTEMWNRIGD
jgi:hypothetical protein